METLERVGFFSGILESSRIVCSQHSWQGLIVIFNSNMGTEHLTALVGLEYPTSGGEQRPEERWGGHGGGVMTRLSQPHEELDTNIITDN